MRDVAWHPLVRVAVCTLFPPCIGILSGCGAARGALPAATVPYAFGAPGGSATPIPEPSAQPGDWPAYGFDSSHTGYNPNETALASGTIGGHGLKTLWHFTAGGVVDAQVVVAADVAVGGRALDLAFFGDEAGDFYALDASSGSVRWSKKLRVQNVSDCDDLPGGHFGITGSATIDRASSRVYVADGQGFLYAFDLGTGQPAPGYANGVALLPDQQEHIYGALTLDAARHALYAATASRCDNAPFHGQIIAVNTGAAAVSHTFWVMGGSSAPSGGGIWGPGGVALDPRGTGYLYALTGNGDSLTAPNAYPLSILKLDPALVAVAGIDPDPTTSDLDFGSTPLVLPPANGCDAYVAVGKAKNGILYAFRNVDDLGDASLVQRIAVAASSLNGDNIGMAAYSPKSGLVYVSNGIDSPSTGIRHGLLAFSRQAGCGLSSLPVWSKVNGPDGGPDDNPPGNPSVADGVVYYTDGAAGQAFAFDAATGRQLWSASLGGPSFTAPSIAGGRVFVSTWGGGSPGAVSAPPGGVIAFGLAPSPVPARGIGNAGAVSRR